MPLTQKTVMRACEGCRRRKIKCDAATTNTWPCSACTRLKLHCVPPTINQEREGGEQMGEHGHLLEYDHAAGLDMQSGMPSGQHPYSTARAGPQMQAYDPGMGVYDVNPYMQRPNEQIVYQDLPQSHLEVANPSFYQAPTYPTPAQQVVPPPQSTTSYLDYEDTSNSLSDALGTLKIDEDGVGKTKSTCDEWTRTDIAAAPYIRENKTKAGSSLPALDEPEARLPPLSNSGVIRIPPELMPSEEDALTSFEIFFSEVHPYVPVLNRAQFYNDWHNNRASMSPLLLEAVFACSGRMADDPAQGAQWLALASRESAYTPIKEAP